MLIYVKRLANKTAHCNCSSKRVKQPSESVWSAKGMVAMGWKQPRIIWLKRLIEWKSQGLKWKWVHFYTSLNHRELCLDSVSFLHKLEMKNYAWIEFHFYTSLKRRTMLEIGLHAPNMMKGRVTKAHLIEKADRMEITRVKNGNGFIFTQAWTIGNYAWVQFHVYTSLKWKTMLGNGLHAPNMMKGRVSCNQMEVIVVKKVGYPKPFWLHPDRDKGEWGDSIRITYR